LIQTAGLQHPGRPGVVDACLTLHLGRAEASQTIPASHSKACLTSISCWCRTAITDHLDLATLSRLAAKVFAARDHAARNDVTMRDADAAIKPKGSTGRIASSSATASPRRWCRRGTGRRAGLFSTATRCCGRVSSWRRRRQALHRHQRRGDAVAEARRDPAIEPFGFDRGIRNRAW